MIRNFLLVLTLFAFTLPINRVADAANAFGLGQKPIPTKFLTIDKLNSIHSIALLEVPDPAYYYFGEGSGGASFMFGIIGTIGEGLATGQDSHEYGDFSFAKNIQHSLRQYLQENNFKVIQTAVNRGEKVALVKDYDSLDIKGVDAYLDVVPLDVGYKQSDLGSVYYEDIGPILSVVVRLISADTKEVLYADTISYGWAKAATTREVDIESPPDHQFTNKADLKANKERAIEQLIQGIHRVSLEIARNFSTGNWYSAKLDSLSDDNLSDLNIGSDDELLYLGMAAAEITSKSYDEALWDRALALAEGDEQKRNGIYIKLRSRQLVTEKKREKAEEIAILNAEMAKQQGREPIEILGVYDSVVKTNKGRKTKSVVVLAQSGNEIQGKFIPDSGARMTGTLKNNKIRFHWTFAGSTYDRMGTWKIKDSRNDRLDGTWENNGNTTGTWKLSKIGPGSAKDIEGLAFSSTNSTLQSAGTNLSGPNITGSYSSEIKGVSNNHKKQYAKLNIVQNGNKITGSFGGSKIKFEGSIEGDTFEIYWPSGWRNWEVKFKVSPDNQITGNYFVGNGQVGQWNLTKVR